MSRKGVKQTEEHIRRRVEACRPKLLGNTNARGARTAEARFKMKESQTVHGHSKPRTPTYRSWEAMKRRCLNPKVFGYKDYGGRGIIVCHDWLVFENFLRDMGERPAWATGGIDRIDPDGNYEPGNCRWATPKEQVNNRRKAVNA